MSATRSARGLRPSSARPSRRQGRRPGLQRRSDPRHLRGQGPGPRRDFLVLNNAFALYVAGARRARRRVSPRPENIDSGREPQAGRVRRGVAGHARAGVSSSEPAAWRPYPAAPGRGRHARHLGDQGALTQGGRPPPRTRARAARAVMAPGRSPASRWSPSRTTSAVARLVRRVAAAWTSRSCARTSSARRRG